MEHEDKAEKDWLMEEKRLRNRFSVPKSIKGEQVEDRGGKEKRKELEKEKTSS